MAKIKFMAIGALGAAALAAGMGVGVVSATPTSSSTKTTSISHSVIKQDRIQAEASVLNTTPSAITQAQKDKTLQTLVSKAGLTKKEFHKDVVAKFKSELSSQGYSQDQIKIGLDQRLIHRLRREIAHLKAGH